MPFPVVPEYITVHLGPPDQTAENVTVPFTDYIKNVASSEIYPTWPESALRANILAQISVALNRVYTEYYRGRGYDFDITSSTRYDQAYVPGRSTFENIDRLVDDSFNDYIVRQGNVEPLYAQFCDGVRTQCPGLSQWGSVDLAEQGLTPYEILQRYFGDNINIVFNAPVGDGTPSYPGRPLTRGSVGEDVRTIQQQLERIRRNYPAIPRITEISNVFDQETEDAVRAFQRIFNLEEDGIVGKATWYKIKMIYNGVGDHQRGTYHPGGTAGVSGGTAAGRHGAGRGDGAVLSGVSGLLPAPGAAYPHHRHLRRGYAGRGLRLPERLRPDGRRRGGPQYMERPAERV